VSGYSIAYTNVTQTFIYNAHRSLMIVVGWTVDSVSGFLRNLFPGMKIIFQKSIMLMHVDLMGL